jgi:eukaryotic-like serine/threonine-protein kinase
MEDNPLLDRWEEIDALFSAALDLPRQEQDAFVRAAVGADEELLAAVLSLLASSDQAQGFLEHPHLVLDAAALQESSAESTLAGERIGPYRLREEIGRGGTGTVYWAERVDGAFVQSVAVKILRRGLDTDDILQRFRVERQILASMNHPNIARLLDGGATDEGRPYLVMELVEGLPITEHCDRLRLGVEERLRLFATAGRAVQYAHRQLVVHRDLKPSNILVTADGTVKLLDFGIAKLLDDAAYPGTTPSTRTGLRLMTPEYASPEQVLGEAVTTTSDVYQLGVLLYELLAGQRPYELRHRSAGEAERMILTQEPLPPSALVTRQRGTETKGRFIPTVDRLARWRGSNVRRLRSRLRGDLDTITLMALRKEPERRYASVADLVDDVERYLQGRPVSARPAAWGYRTRKLAQRNPGAAVATLMALFALGGYIGTLQAHADRLERERNVARMERREAETARQRAEQAQRAAEYSQRATLFERGRAEAERDRAEAALESTNDQRRRAQAALVRERLESEKAERVTDFLVSLFEAFDPEQSRGENPTARELLGRGVRQAEGLSAHPHTQADLFEVLNRVYRSLGLYDEAHSLAERSFAIRRELFGPDHPLVAASLNSVGEIQRRRGNLATAAAMQSEALAIQRRRLGPEHPGLATSLNYLGEVRRQQGDLSGAEALHREALALLRRVLGNEHPSVATTLNDLGEVRRRQGHFADAEALHREALALRRTLLGEEHPMVAASLNNVGLALGGTGDLGGAESHVRQALTRYRRTFGEVHPSVASTLNNLGLILARKRDLDEAEKHYREALALRRTLLGGEHPMVAASLFNLGRFALYQKDDLEAAETYLREALALYSRIHGRSHPEVAASLHYLSSAMRRRGDLDGAESYLREALALRRTLLRPEHPHLVMNLTALGNVLLLKGDLVGAEPYYREALEVQRRELGEDHPEVVHTRKLLADLGAARGGLAEQGTVPF